MKVIGWSMFFGVATGYCVTAVAGFIWGGIHRVAPCHSAPDFSSGGVFGSLIFVNEYGLPVCIAGAALGAVVGAVLSAKKISLAC
jgi:hypothetical protein